MTNFLKAVKSYQLSLMTLLAENRKLKQQNSELLASSSKKRRGGGEEERFGYKSHIVGLAKLFLFTRALWVDTTQFRPRPPEPSPNPQDQFASDKAYAQSITTALYQDIPVQFHPLLDSQTYGSFAKDVRVSFFSFCDTFVKLT